MVFFGRSDVLPDSLSLTQAALVTVPMQDTQFESVCACSTSAKCSGERHIDVWSTLPMNVLEYIRCFVKERLSNGH